jgi:V8-like Glu-specific endopeptidase
MKLIGIRTVCLTILVGVAFIVNPLAALAQVYNQPISSGTLDTRSSIAPWTQERMDAAKSKPLPTLGGNLVAKAGTSPWGYTSYPVTPDITAMYRQLPYRGIGKLFFYNPYDGFDYVCSAAVVNAPNQDTIWTAGHCVYEPGVGFMQDWVFVPGRHDGKNPFGTWTSREAWVLPGWSTHGLFEYDMGAINLNVGGRSGSTHIQVIGGLNFIANLNRKQHFHVRGYPAAPPFNGEKHHICATSWVINDQPSDSNSVAPKTMGIGCDMSSGVSGGPLIVNWGTDNYLNGNVSYGYSGVSDQLYSPYFGNAAQSLYNNASGTE